MNQYLPLLERWGRLGPILLLAFVLRLGWALLVPVIPISDGVVYDIFAREIAAGHGYVFPNGDVTVYWAVGTSALYGAVYALFGAHYWLIAALNLVMGCVLVAAIYKLALVRFDLRVAAIAGAIAAIWPIWIQLTTIPNSELPGTLFLLLGLLARHEMRLPGWGRIILSTALLVASAYVRPTVLPLIILLPLLDGGYRKPMRAAFHCVLALLVAGALLAPWMERNRAQFGKPVLVSANFGANLWMGNNPASSGGYMELPDSHTTNEVQRDAYFKNKAIAFIRDNPLHYLALCAKRIPLSFDRETIGVAWNVDGISKPFLTPIKLLSTVYWLAALSLSLIGVALYIFQNPLRIFDSLIASPALTAAICILVVGQDRYHLGMDPFVAIFAAFAIVQATGRRAAKANAPLPHNSLKALKANDVSSLKRKTE